MASNVKRMKTLNPRPAGAPVPPSDSQGNPVVTSGGTAQPLVKGMAKTDTSGGPVFMGQNTPGASGATAVSSVGSTNPMLLFVRQLRDMTGSFSILNDDIITNNVKMALGGFSAEDRTLPYEIADYLMSNMGFIFMGLVLDNNFKTAFKDALNMELQLDTQPENVRAAMRAKMKDPNKKYKTRGSMVVGTSDFVPEMKANLSKKMHLSFSALDGFAEEFDTEIDHLTREQKVEYGFIFSNFMYLLRAFIHNDMFMSYVISVVERVKSMTGNK